MPKVRVHEVAKQLKINSKILIDKLVDMGIEVKNHMSAIEENQAKSIIDYYTTGMKPNMAINEQKPTSDNLPKQENETKRSDSGAEQENVRHSQQPQQGQQGNQGNQGQQGQQGQRNQNYKSRQPNQNQQGSQRGHYDKKRSDNRQGGYRPDYRQQGQGQYQGQQGQGQSQGQGQGQGQGQNQGQRDYRPKNQYQKPQSSSTQQRSYSDNRPPQQRSPQDRPYQKEGYSGGNRPQTQRSPQQGGAQNQRSQSNQTQRPNWQQSQNQKPNFRSDSKFRSPQGGGYNKSGDSHDGNKGYAAKQSFNIPIPVAKVDTDTAKKRTEQRGDQRNQNAAKKPQKKQISDVFLQAPKKPKKPPKKKVLKEAELLNVVDEKNEDITTVVLPKSMKVKDFSEKINKQPAEIIKLLMKRGVLANINQEVDFHALAKIAEEFEIIVERATEVDILGDAFADEQDDPNQLKERPPVVVVMGHVDHGKTSLLDCIRKTAVTQTEAGGITQHIGAYTVSIDQKNIAFLDTPGHEAFTAMRMRGAQVTDIAVLVVAADDGVMPQTIEAIDHAKAAGVEIIVAINKIDKPSANPDRVKQELVEYGLLVEDWGGQIICAPVSAQTGEGIDHLLEMIILVAEMKELRANPNKKARGTVIEALLDKGRGPVATVLVQDGTLSIGDPIVAGQAFGKVRAMMDYTGKKVTKALPSTPVEILGLSEVPLAGDAFYVAQNEKHARQVAESLIAHGREEMVKAMPQKISLDDLFSQIQAGNVKDLNIVVKADVQGSVEAIKNSLERLSNEEVRIRTIHGGVGAITETDVMLASASNAIIIGFNVRAEASARSVADTEKVDIRLYRVIYNAIEDINAAMKGMLDPVFQEKVIGHAEIRQIFKASGVGNIAGAHVVDGKFTRNCQVRIMRDGKVIYDGVLDALKRFKDDAKEVNAGYDCGLLFNKHNDIMEQDMVESYIMEEVPR